MGDDGKRRIGLGRGNAEYATGSRQFLPTVTSHDARLTEQSLHGRVATGYGTRMAGGGTTATLAASGLDGGYPTALSDQATGMEEQFIGVGNILNVK